MSKKSYKQFGDFPRQYSEYDSSRIVLLPVPFDKTSTWKKGADKAPSAILEASYHLENYDIQTSSEVYKKGIHTHNPVFAETSLDMIEQVYTTTSILLSDNKFVGIIGGEHSVSLGAFKAHKERNRDAFSILQLDAHSDRRDKYENSAYNHACVMARAKEYTDSVVSVGIRSLDKEELALLKTDTVIYAHEVLAQTNWCNKALEALSEDVYITIDLDVFDPSIMPSTGTPEPGGLLWYDVLTLLKRVAAEKNIIGFDIVELCPTDNHAPDFLAAKLIYSVLSYKYYA